MTRDDKRGRTPARADTPAATPGRPSHQRIAKAMARAGLCSRRDAEAWIMAGRVSVNGQVLTSPALDVGPDDAIFVDDAPMPAPERTRLFLFHKPRGLVTSEHDPEGRPTVADFLRDNWPEGPRTVTVGRLDINTEGLLLLTNDGGLARALELPQTGWMRRYRVRAKGSTDQPTLDSLAAGLSLDGVDYAGIEAKIDRIQGSNCWLTMGLREGKNREIKRVLEHVGLEVNRLIRLSFGPFQLLDLPEGAVEEVRTRVLRDQLGEALAGAAGVDFGDVAPAANSGAMRVEHQARPPVDARHEPTHASDRHGSDRHGSDPHGSDRRGPERRASQGPGRPDGRERSKARDGRRDRTARDSIEPESPPAKRERPQSGPRKHVSTLRASMHGKTQDRRTRIERTETSDRNARPVRVERLVSARQSTADRPRTRGDDGRPDTRGGDRPKRGHSSPSALGKRERVARSSGRGSRPDTRKDDGDRRDDEALRQRRKPPGAKVAPRRQHQGPPQSDTRREGPASATKRFDAKRPRRETGSDAGRGERSPAKRGGPRSKTSRDDAPRGPKRPSTRGRGPAKPKR